MPGCCNPDEILPEYSEINSKIETGIYNSALLALDAESLARRMFYILKVRYKTPDNLKGR